MTLIGCARCVLLLVCSMLLNAQEIKYIDLTAVPQRTKLRHPPAPPSVCKDGTSGCGGGYGGGGVADGAPDHRDPHRLGVYLLSISPTDINAAEPFEAEFKVLNTGLAPIELPVSPHLSDLQPSDESIAFSYLSIALVVAVEDEPRSISQVELYGSSNHNGTLVALKPGEWIRVRANVTLRSSPLRLGSALMGASFWLRKNTFYPHPGGSFHWAKNLYPNVTITPFIPVHLLGSETPQR